MAKIEELLEAQGFTKEEIAANADLFKDPKVRGALEGGYSKLEESLTKYKTENDGWAEWHEKHGKPTLALYEKDRADAIAEAAALKARLKLAEDGGFAPPSPAPLEVKAEPVIQGAAFDPKAHKLITQDDAAKMMDAEGEAIAMMTNISEEYRYLTGKSIFDYKTEVDGRTVRGAQALRQEALKSGKRMDQYVAEKFDFNSKRQAIADKQRLDAEEAIRADERSKVAAQYGDPNVRPMMPSTSPFMPRPEADRKQPWEAGRSPQQLRTDRLNRAMQLEMKGATQ